MDTLSVILNLGGGLGLFLYGMKLMSDSVEKVAGAKLRSVLEVLTKNKFVGLLVGIAFTAIVQSSSATTVMVVSFVNAGLMDLYQAAGVILGANIGTTVTSQLVSFDLSQYAPIFVLVGAVMFLFFKNPTTKKIGEVIIGFGILFTGLNMMSSSMETLKDSVWLTEILSSLKNPLLAVLAGFVITSILQSSSVTVSIVLLMASQGLLELPICFYLILGCNIGSCTTALLASLSGKKDAKRAALIHFFFNVIGSAIIAVILALAMDPIESFILWISGDNIGRAVANAHTLIKVCQVIMLFPFTNQLVKLTYFFVKGDDEGYAQAQLMYIGDKNNITPSTAVPQVIKELSRMGNIATKNLDASVDALLEENEEEANQVLEVEKTIDYLDHEITNFLVEANRLSLPVDDRKLVGGLFHVVSDIERIGDHAVNIAEDAKVKKNMNLSFTEEGNQDLRDMTNLVDQILKLSLEMFTNSSYEHMEEILELENAIDLKEREIQDAHIERLNQNKCTAQAGMMFTDLASNLERVGDHATNIAFSILEVDPENEKIHEKPINVG